MTNIGMPGLLVIVALLILLFGAKKIPQLAKGAGEGLRLFRKELKGIDSKNDSET